VETAKLFVNGQSQAVRLPKEYRFSGSEVYIQKVGDAVMLFPKERAWETFLNGLNGFTDDFFEEGRDQGVQTPRDTL
jgi:antitoxin VapB